MSSSIFNAMVNAISPRQNANHVSDNFLVNMALNSLKSKNGQAYDNLMNIIKSGENPDKYVKQMISNASPQQISQLRNMLSIMGVNNSEIDSLLNN